MSRGTVKIAAFLVLCCSCPRAVFALDLPLREISDDSSVRKKLFDEWFIDAPPRVPAKSARRETLPGGERIEVRTERMEDEFSIVLAREFGGAFPGWAQGSWVISRSVEDGSLLRIQIFPRSDPYTYIQFHPLDSERSRMDMVVYNAYLAQSVNMPAPIERLLTLPLQDILESANNKTLFRYFEPYTGDYADTRTLISRIRRFLPDLSFADDGAINEDGDYVFINTLEKQAENPGLNCSGFAKWLVDGLLRPLTGRRLPINILKQAYGQRGSSFTAPFETLRDPFFGLDWVRNLASAVNGTLKSPAFAVLEELEVNRCPFSQIILRKDRTTRTEPYGGFLPEAGFDINGLAALMYTLAIDEPGMFYLGAVNTELAPKPRMRQYFHVAAFFPYFDENGAFHVVLFESAAETSFNRFAARYPGHYINLVRIPVEKTFEP
ncbi:MAG: hypothetical protein LBD44_04055 [Spirochaetaceae bacterium]|jgi:hypothetical protein|nr:hypothetical protein [Spirochaetaceae bacterium]